MQLGVQSQPVTAYFFANRGSRRGSEAFESARSALADVGVAVEIAEAFDDVEVMDSAIRQVAGPDRLIIVGGGDGTLSVAIPAILEANAVLGVMPLGTGNQFALDLAIPNDLSLAAQAIAQGRIARTDVSHVNDRPFVTVATMGLTTQIARGLDPTAKRLLGKLAYGLATYRALKRIRPFHAVIELPNKTIAADVIQVVLGNGRLHAGPFPLSPDASITDGLMDGYAITAMPKKHLWRIAMRLPLAGHIALEEVPAFRADRVMLTTQPKTSLTVDGEEEWYDRMEFRVNPGALRVVVPFAFGCDSSRIETIGNPVP